LNELTVPRAPFEDDYSPRRRVTAVQVSIHWGTFVEPTSKILIRWFVAVRPQSSRLPTINRRRLHRLCPAMPSIWSDAAVAVLLQTSLLTEFRYDW